jgi:hypothetical protein
MKIQHTVIGIGGEPVSVGGDPGSTQAQAQAAYDMYLEREGFNRRQADALGTYDPQRMALEQTYAETPLYKKPLIGAGQSVMETVTGVGQMLGQDRVFGLPSAEEVQQIGEKTPWDFAGGAGYLGGEIGQALPFGMAAKAMGAGPATAEMVAGAMQEGLKPADDMFDRMTNAGIGGAAGAVLPMAGGVRPIPEAADLMQRAGQQGTKMRLTPGQQGGDMWARAEQGMEALPLVGYAIRHHQTKGLKDWNRLVLREVALDGSEITEVGQKGLQQVDAQFRQGYDEITDQLPEVLPPGAQTDFLRTYFETEHYPRLRPEDLEAVDKDINYLFDLVEGGRLPREAAKTQKGEFDKLAQGAFRAGNVRLGAAYRDLSRTMTNLMKENLSVEAGARLDYLDSKYGEFLPVVRAHAYKGVAKEDLMTPEHLLGAIKAEDTSLRDKKFALGQMPLQPETQAAIDSLGRRIPATGPGSAEKILGGGGVLGAIMNPEAAIPAATALGGASAATYPAAPFMRGNNRAQGAARTAMDAMSRAPGAAAQVSEQTGEAIVNAVVPEAQADMPLNPEQYRRLEAGIDFAVQLGADNVARQLATVRNRVMEGTAEPDDINRAQEVLEAARDRARRGGDKELAATIEQLFIDTEQLYFPQD